MPLSISFGVRGESVGDIGSNSIELNETQKRLYLIMGLLALLLIVNTFSKQMFGFALNEKLVLLGFGLLMFMPKVGFLDWEDTRDIPYEIIFLFGAGFSIALAFTKTGLASEIANTLSSMASLHIFLIFILVSAFVAFSTEVTSNTALTSIAIPIFYDFAKEMPSQDGMFILMVATVSASYAFMLPIATPPNAIVMSSRVIPISHMAKVGFWINIVAIYLFVYSMTNL